MKKVCIYCGIEKDEADFCKNKNSCKDCRKIYNKKYLEKNKEQQKERKKKYREENKDKIIEARKIFWEKNKKRYALKHKKYYEENKEQQKEYKKKYYEENKDKIRERKKIKRKKYYQEHKKEIESAKKLKEKMQKDLRKKKDREKFKCRYNSDTAFRILVCLRKRVRKTITCKDKKSSFTTIELIGVNQKFLRSYLESQFEDGMSWDNYGVNGWHIDHIIPCSLFDLTNPEEQKKCFNYKNLRPCWQMENILKKDILDMNLVEQYKINNLLPK